MPRGRPKGSKNHSKVEIVKQDITQEVIEKKTVITTEEKITKPLKINAHCDLCNAPIRSSPYRVQLQSLTGKASWHRVCKLEKLLICESCAQELSDTIDKFILKKNPALKKEFILQ